MNSVDRFLILTHHNMSTDDVVVIENFGVVAIENTLNKRIVVVKNCDGLTEVIPWLDYLPVVFKVKPIFSLHFGEQSIHALGMANISIVFIDESKERIALTHEMAIFIRTGIVDTNPLGNEMVVKAVF